MRKYYFNSTRSILALVIGLLITIGPLASQATFEPFTNDNVSSFIRVSTIGGYDSNGLKSELFRSFMKGGWIDNAIRKSSIPKTELTRKLGAELSGKIEISFPYSKLLKNDSLNMLLTVSRENIMSVDYNQTLFNLLFFGNKSYLDESAVFNNVNYDHWNIRSLGIGIVNLSDHSSLSLALYQGLSHTKYEIEKGALQVSDEGKLLNMDIQGSFFDSVTNDSTSQSGIGVGVNGRINLLKKNTDTKLYIDFKNFGVMFWNKGSRTRRLKDVEDFEGVVLNDFFSANSSETILGDVWENESVSNNYHEFLPARLKVSVLKEIKPSLRFFMMLNSQSINHWSPEIFVGIQKDLNKSILLGTSVKYGGYGGANANIYGSYKPNEKWSIYLDVRNLSGWVSKKGYGSFVGLGVAHYFNFKSTE